MSAGHGRGRRAVLVAIMVISQPSSLFGATPVRVEVGGGAIEVTIDPADRGVPRASILRWVERSATAVSSYFGRFPVASVRLRLVTGGRGSIGGGTTWGGRRPSMRVFVGRETREKDFDDDWLLTHEMVHLAFPEMADEHHWIEEGLATYVEPLARARVGWLEPEAVWEGLVEGLPQGLERRRAGGLDGTRSWGKTYWGGALFWFLADVEIREKSGNRRGLREALRGILDAGGSIGVSWTIERALAVGDAVTELHVLRDLYARMGPAAMDVDLDALWKRLGVARRGQGVTFDDRAPLAAIRRAMTDRGDAAPPE